MGDLKPFLVRLTPESVAIRAKAAADLSKTKALLINEAIQKQYGK